MDFSLKAVFSQDINTLTIAEISSGYSASVLTAPVTHQD
jgi:hypothetical protein